ncbi:MAG TPA: OmpA family protein [Candidatus Angelobacter sp.]
MKNLAKSIVAAAILILALTGCRHNVTTAKVPQAPPAQTVAPEASLTVSPATVERGQSAQLSWNTQNAATITIDGIGPVESAGSRTITPNESTTYHLLAKSSGGTAEATARVSVHATLSKAPQLTEEQLFAQNVKDIFFNYDNAEIISDEKSVLSSNLEFLAKHNALNIVIEGHCDERGSDEYNLSLGESRAEKVKAALIQGGVGPERIKIISYGKERPFCSAAENETCWQQNRRAHFTLQSQNRAAAN